jgi:hypothetical protein
MRFCSEHFELEMPRLPKIKNPLPIAVPQEGLDAPGATSPFRVLASVAVEPPLALAADEKQDSRWARLRNAAADSGGIAGRFGKLKAGAV